MTRRRVAVVATLLAFCGLLSGDVPVGWQPTTQPVVRAEPDTKVVADVLSRRTQALRDGDLDDWLATLDSGDAALLAAQRTMFRRVRALPLQTWAYVSTPAGWIIRYRLDGDTGDSEVPVRPELRLRDDRWVLTSIHQLHTAVWDIGDVSVTSGRHSVVLGETDLASQQRLTRLADNAVAAVDAVWRAPWPHQLVVVIPDRWADATQLLGSDLYARYAALTTSINPPGRRTDARILLNPHLVSGLSDAALQSLLTHEATHVATQPHDVPSWLAEGLADHVVYHDVERSRISQAVPDLLRAVYAGWTADRLPVDQDFADGTGKTYEAAHLAVRVLGDHFGNDRLTTFYTAVSDRRGDWEGVLYEKLGWDSADWTQRWKELIAELAHA
jgi:hypothetical protein